MFSTVAGFQRKSGHTVYSGVVLAPLAQIIYVLLSCSMKHRFTGYINRIRGYHADKEKQPGYEMGRIDSWYYAIEDRFDHMQHYYPVKQSFYAREFPTSWRLIDTTLETS